MSATVELQVTVLLDRDNNGDGFGISVDAEEIYKTTVYLSDETASGALIWAESELQAIARKVRKAAS